MTCLERDNAMHNKNASISKDAAMDYKNPALSPEIRAEDLLNRMTLEEKAAQLDMTRGVSFATKPSTIHTCSVDADTEYDFDKLHAAFGDRGVGCVHDNYTVPAAMNRLQKYFVERTRLGIPCLFTGEALHGIGGLRGTIFPCPINWGSTFDTDLVKAVGEAIGREARALGIHEILGPNLDVSREPRWGRIEETFGEDTYLSSRMAVAVISGVQKGDISRPDAVIAEPKHYCVHGIAEGGTNCSPARAGTREVESCYLPVFEAGIQEGGAYNAMVSYNSVDGDLLMCSKHYLDTVLKKRIGLKGFTRSDWGGVGRIKSLHHLVKTDKDAICLAINNGLDVQGCDYPNDVWETTLVDLVREGRIAEERIRDACRRVLCVKFELGIFEHPYTDENRFKAIIRCEAHRELSLQAARESIVLLKNNGVLPLSHTVQSLALIGPSSAAQKIGGYSPIAFGYGIPSVYDELKAAVGNRIVIRQCNGCAITEVDGERMVDGQAHLDSAGEGKIEDTIDEALAIAAQCDVIVMVGGDNTVTSGEGRDRCELTLAGRQRELVEKLAKLGKRLILVLENGKPLDISAESRVSDAVLMAWFGGELGARAIVEALIGKINPAGRLPISLPQSSTRIPCYYSMLPGGSEEFFEGQKSALFPFGFGLSYTKFEYADLRVEKTGKYEVHVAVAVTNTGRYDGDEVVQLYVDDVESSVVTPPMLLKGFERISLKTGECKIVEFTLNYDSFKLMDLTYNWVVEPGEFRIRVGSGSSDIRCEASVMI